MFKYEYTWDGADEVKKICITGQFNGWDLAEMV